MCQQWSSRVRLGASSTPCRTEACRRPSGFTGCLQMGDCSNGTCAMAVTGPGSLDTDNFAKLNATSYTVAVTVRTWSSPAWREFSAPDLVCSIHSQQAEGISSTSRPRCCTLSLRLFRRHLLLAQAHVSCDPAGVATAVTSCRCLLRLCEVAVQANNETEPVDVWYLLTSCTGATSQVLVHSITYDITPPYLTIIKLTGDTNTTIITTEPSDYSAVTAVRRGSDLSVRVVQCGADHTKLRHRAQCQLSEMPPERSSLFGFPCQQAMHGRRHWAHLQPFFMHKLHFSEPC